MRSYDTQVIVSVNCSNVNSLLWVLSFKGTDLQLSRATDIVWICSMAYIGVSSGVSSHEIMSLLAISSLHEKWVNCHLLAFTNMNSWWIQINCRELYVYHKFGDILPLLRNFKNLKGLNISQLKVSQSQLFK